MAYLHPLGIKSFFIRKNKKEKRETKRLQDFYLNVNDYFKNIKENIDIIIKSEENFKNSDDFAKIYQNGDDFANLKNDDGKTYDEKIIKNPTELETIDWNVLKDKDSSKEYVDEIEKLRLGVERVLERSGYPFANEEELRMLSDEPRIVEREDESYMESEVRKNII